MIARGLILTVLLAVPAARAAELSTPRVDAARQAGWDVAGLILETTLSGTDAARFPGVDAFLRHLVGQAERVDPDQSPRAWRSLGLDDQPLLGLRWRATYEVAPADPAWVLLQGSLLLAEGEVHRALHALAIARHAANAEGPWQATREDLIARAWSAILEGIEQVRPGIEASANGDFQTALLNHRMALEAWPQNATAHHELAQTRSAQLIDELFRTANARTAPRSRDPFQELSPLLDPRVKRGYERARFHDPHFWMAYQGEEPSLMDSALILQETILPAWDRIAARPEVRLTEGRLLHLAVSYQQAGAQEMALLVRQVLVSRRGEYLVEDLAFIDECLPILAPGPNTRAALRRLRLATQVVLPLAARPRKGAPTR